jgi:hypothetical protein
MVSIVEASWLASGEWPQAKVGQQAGHVKLTDWQIHGLTHLPTAMKCVQLPITVAVMMA